MNSFENSKVNGDFKDKVDIVNIFSGDRNLTSFPSPNKYTIKFIDKLGNTYKNVKSIRLLSGVLPDVNNIQQEPFLILDIGDSNDAIRGTSNVLNNASSILQLDRPLETGFFFNLKSDVCKSMYHTYNQPIAELSQLNIDIRDYSGELFNFGTDVDPLVPNKSIQHLLTFEIITEVKDYTHYNNIY